jgi:glycosyltransferase involved in cell wall biosynthesis
MGLWLTLAETLRVHAKWRALESAKPVRRRGSGRHLALLAWALPPNSNAGVHRPLSLLRYGPGAGWRVAAFHGVAPANQRQHGEELRASIPDVVRLCEVAELKLQPSYRATPQIDGGFGNAIAFARHAIATLRDDPPDVVLASGPPFFVFVAARWLARHFGVSLVLDYRDEWSECPFDFVAHGRDDRAWEERCHADAAAVVFTTESHRRHQIAAFAGLEAARTHVLPNGWEPGDFETSKEARGQGSRGQRSDLSCQGPVAARGLQHKNARLGRGMRHGLRPVGAQ